MSNFFAGVLAGMPLGIIALITILAVSAHANRYGTFLPARPAET